MSSTKINQNRYMMSSGRTYNLLILLCDVLVTSFLIEKTKGNVNWIWYEKKHFKRDDKWDCS